MQIESYKIESNKIESYKISLAHSANDEVETTLRSSRRLR